MWEVYISFAQVFIKVNRNFLVRFDVDSLKWVIIADMHEGVSGASLSNFNDKYIYRFGGRTYLGE